MGARARRPGSCTGGPSRNLVDPHHAARSQVLATLERALSVAFPEPLERPALADRGRADYPSSSRVMRLRHALADRKTPVKTSAFSTPWLVGQASYPISSRPMATSGARQPRLPDGGLSNRRKRCLSAKLGYRCGQIVVQTHA